MAETQTQRPPLGNIVIGAIAGIAAILFTSFLIFLIVLIAPDLYGLEFALILGLVAPFLLYIGWGRLIQKINTKLWWTQLIAIILSLGLVLLYVFSALGFQLDIDTGSNAQKGALIFGICYILGTVLYWVIHGGIRMIKRPFPNSPKMIPVGAYAILLLVISSGLLIAADSLFIHGSIQKGTGYNDGPWLLFGSDPTTSMKILWLTAEKNTSVVYYGTDPGNLDLQMKENFSKNLHRIELTGLTPDTTYYYRIPETFDTPHSATLFNFTTAPTAARSFKFAVIGDKQPTTDQLLYTNMLVADGVIAGDYDFITQVGDLASSGAELNDWHMVLQSISKMGANTPLQMAMGNHDYGGTIGATNWRNLFPYDFAAGMGRSYHSFDYLNAHFVMIDNFERLYSMSPGQLQWIEDDITDAKDRGQEWIFVFFHLSVFTVSTSGLYTDLQKQLVPLFDKLPVDAVFYGHDHDYQAYNFTYGKNGLVFDKDHTWPHRSVPYFCTGGGGANLEVDYGVLTMSPSQYTVDWYNISSGAPQTITYEKRAWNKDNFVTNPGFPINYTQYSDSGEYDGKYYFYDPTVENYADFADQYGFIYGEQTYHYMQIEIDGNTCTISARYPNGVVLSGPGNTNPQIYTLSK
jgi:hypothetical protein